MEFHSLTYGGNACDIATVSRNGQSGIEIYLLVGPKLDRLDCAPYGRIVAKTIEKHQTFAGMLQNDMLMKDALCSRCNDPKCLQVDQGS